MPHLGLSTKCSDHIHISIHRSTPQALKIVNKSLLRKVKRGDGGSALQDVLREVAILKRLRHPNVVRLYEVMDDPDSDKMFLVMEYVEGGQILTMKGQKSDVIFDEVKARKVCQRTCYYSQSLSAVRRAWLTVSIA